MSKNIRSSAPASSGVRAASATRCARATAASCLLCPKVNSRKKIPNVDGAYTSLNTRGVPPARSTPASSMLSAPQAIAATIEVSLPAGLTAPDFTRVDGSTTCSPISRERPDCSASSSTGTNPDADTKFRSSNTADPAVNVYDECIESAFSDRGQIRPKHSYYPRPEGIFAIHTPIKSPAHPRIQAKAPRADYQPSAIQAEFLLTAMSFFWSDWAEVGYRTGWGTWICGLAPFWSHRAHADGKRHVCGEGFVSGVFSTARSRCPVDEQQLHGRLHHR